MNAASTCQDTAQTSTWPSLELLALTQDEEVIRKQYVGGSDANIIAGGDNRKIRELWEIKRREREEPDLTSEVAVMLGTWTEEFNCQWFERVTRLTVTRKPPPKVSSSETWRRCSLDGYVEEEDAIWEAKHTNAFTKSRDALKRFMPQLQHNMSIYQVERAFLSVIFGNQRHEIFEIRADWAYQLDLIEIEHDFWECVQSGQRPVAADVRLDPAPVATREINMSGNNRWADFAATWLQNRLPAKRFEKARAGIKELVENDVSCAFGHGIEARRTKSGSIVISEMAR